MTSNQEQISGELTPVQTAVARSHTYTLLSQLMAQGLTPQTLTAVQQIDYFTDALSSMPNHKTAGGFDLDEAAALHQDIFGFSMYPYQSVFLDTSNLLGGSETDRVLETYQQAGADSLVDDLLVSLTGDMPDHIATELAFLAFLCGAEADAYEDGLVAVARRMAQLQHDFLREHLLRWLPPLVIAIEYEENPFYTAIAQLLLDFVGDHASSDSTNRTPSAFTLPSPPALLDDEKTSLKDIAGFLLRPSYTGIYLSRTQLRKLARQYRLPHGFGEREQVLTNLLRTAVQYDTFTVLIDALSTQMDLWQEQYQLQIVEYSVLTTVNQQWHTRIEQTKQMLEQVKTKANSLE